MTLAIILDYAFQFVGTPYIWGGNNILQGVDCSGYANEIARFSGLIGKEDLKAHDLYLRLSAMPGATDNRGAGAYVFYGSHDAITHVGFMVDENRILEAGGGGRSVKTVERAREKGALVRGRMIDYRPDRIAIVMPPYDQLP